MRWCGDGGKFPQLTYRVLLLRRSISGATERSPLPTDHLFEKRDDAPHCVFTGEKASGNFTQNFREPIARAEASDFGGT
jgi:hypothetical protein